jgi:hypothetical protein
MSRGLIFMPKQLQRIMSDLMLLAVPVLTDTEITTPDA